MKRDIGDFVRRLPIIMLEDTCLHFHSDYSLVYVYE